MDGHRVDRIAVLLGATRPRRGALRLLAAGLAGPVLVARLPRPAAALLLCPERVPDPDHVPTANGCGPSGLGAAVPDR